jgi:hypothetical protein
MEEAVYICSWRQTSRGFTFWVTSRPEFRAEGPTIGEAEEGLIEVIMSGGGAMHPVIEFNPPLPKSDLEAQYSQPELYLIGGDDSFDPGGPGWLLFETPAEREERLKRNDSFFESPVGRKCANATSPRSARPLVVGAVSRRCDGAFGHVGIQGNTCHQIVSKDFLDLLTPNEKAGLQLQRATSTGRASNFFELVGPAGPPFVAVAGMEPRGWRCAACTHRTWGYWVDGLAINSFIAKADIPVTLLCSIDCRTESRAHHSLAGSGTTYLGTSRFAGISPRSSAVGQPETKPVP